MASTRVERRYTIDASVFVNAFHLHERGNAESLRLLDAIEQARDPIIVPTIILAEIAAAAARTANNTAAAITFAASTASLRHLMFVSVTEDLARNAAEVAATYRLRGSDAVYVAVARRYATILISRDEEQITRGSRVVTCRRPEQVLEGR